MLCIGFTGTQLGMSETQQRVLQMVLPKGEPFILHHGDCIGADAQAHMIALSFMGRIVVHPPSNSSKRAFCKGDDIRGMLPYLERNRQIVLEGVDGLIATPSGSERNNPRSGTWATVRMARHRRRFITVIQPDGVIITENGPKPW